MLERRMVHDQRHDVRVVELGIRLERGHRHPVKRRKPGHQEEAERQPQPQRTPTPSTALDHS